MRVTVAVCTWNRCLLLRQALESMTALRIPAGTEWELLVVNNRCTDATDEVIAAFTGTLPLRRVYEPEPGLSHARNAAVREATGTYILWTDDDTLVDPGWLAAYVEAYERWPRAVMFGGPVMPWFMAPPPAWVKSGWSLIAEALAVRDLGPSPLLFDGGDNMPFGANYAVRIEEQRHCLYDPRLGMRAGTLMVGEETRVLTDLLAAGFEGRWVPGASVRHCIPPSRMTTRYLRRYHFGVGRSWAVTEPRDGSPTLLGRPRWAWKRAFLCEAKYLGGRWLSPPEVWLKNLISASRAWGYLRHY
jgi:glycosyltransferase involved in cell wall biosynthesis